MAAVTHDLRQFRYLTSLQRHLPWSHVRHVSVSDLRHEAPDLPLMANLISGLADCDITLSDVRAHNDGDLVQLLLVLQACLQFTLWSQNILKEKMLELQSSQVARRVTAKQLDHVEARCRVLTKEMAAVTSERDTLALGTASLRTSLVQLETTVRMQERQVKQERERTSQLVAQLEKAYSERAPAQQLNVPASAAEQRNSSGVRCPTCGHRSGRKRRISRGGAGDCVDVPPLMSRDDTSDSTATSYSDSMYGAEAEALFEARLHQRRHPHWGGEGGGCTSVHPAPCLDWRTLVRYILHEERGISAWATPPTRAADGAPLSVAVNAAVVPAAAAVAPMSPSPPHVPAVLSMPPETAAQLQALFAEFTACVGNAVSDYARGTATQTREVVSAMAGQRLKETAEAQHVLLSEARAALRTVTPPMPPPTAAAAAAVPAIAPVEADMRSPSTPLRLSNNVMRRVDGSTMSESSKEAVAHFMRSISEHSSERTRGSGTPMTHFDTAAGGWSPLLTRYEGSPPRGSAPPSLFASPVSSPLPTTRGPPNALSLHRSASSITARGGGNNSGGGGGGGSMRNSRSSLLPAFSPDILRTPLASPNATNSSRSGMSSQSSHDMGALTPKEQPLRTAMNVVPQHHSEKEEEDDDEQPPDADFRLPSSSSTTDSRTSTVDSYQSSTGRPAALMVSGDSGRRVGGGAAGAAATAVSAPSKTTAAVATPAARPRTTPPVYPGVSASQSGSPLTMSPPVTAFALYRAASLHSSMRSDASGGSTHASSQMLRDTQRELEALLAEDAAAEKAKTQN